MGRQSVDEALDQVFREFLAKGWVRLLPSSAMQVIGAAAILEAEGRPGSLEDAEPFGRPGDLATSIWDHDPGDPLLADEDFRSWLEEREALLARMAAHVGIPAPVCVGNLAELMCRLGLVQRDGIGPVSRWRVARPLPLPEDVVPLTNQERDAERRLRWLTQHDRDAQRLIRQFTDDRLTTLTTSLQRLARRLDVEVDGARAAVLTLVEAGDFTADRDVEHIAPHKVFNLTVDWPAFDAYRLTVRLAPVGQTEAVWRLRAIEPDSTIDND
jgi:hypothetical protein